MPAILDYSKFLSETSKKRMISPIRALLPLLKLPDMISLGGGFPNPDMFPFASFSFTLKTGETISLSHSHLDQALQYSPSAGLPSLISHLHALQSHQHLKPCAANTENRKTEFKILVSTGSQDALTKTFEMILNKGDSILLEDPTYPGALSFLRPMEAKLLPVPIDEHGLVPEALQNMLDQLVLEKQPLPKALYTIPTAQNPSGTSLPLERKRKLYQLAQRYDFLILEDDPYFYLEESKAANSSFLSLDVDGRVLRFDSLSKVLSAGLRIGWVTGPAPLIERLDFHSQATALHPSGLSQAVVSAVFDLWGIEGFLKHAQKVTEFYRQRKERAVHFAGLHISKYADWVVPQGGMFLWIKLRDVDDSKALIEHQAREHKVLLLPGDSFSPLSGKPTPYIRASYSTASDEQLDQAFQRLALILAPLRK